MCAEKIIVQLLLVRNLDVAGIDRTDTVRLEASRHRALFHVRDVVLERCHGRLCFSQRGGHTIDRRDIEQAGIEGCQVRRNVGTFLLHEIRDLAIETESVLDRLYAGVQGTHDGFLAVRVCHHVAAVTLGDLDYSLELFRGSCEQLPWIECGNDATRLHVFELRGAHAEVVATVLFDVGHAVDFLRQVQPAHVGL